MVIHHTPRFSMRGTILISCFSVEWSLKALFCVSWTFCSPNRASTWNAQSIWTTARNISFSAKCIPGQIRLLCNLCNQNLNIIRIHLPSPKYPMITFPWILRVCGFRRRDIVFKISLWLKDHCKDYFSYSQRKNLPWMCGDLDTFEDHGA